MGASADAVAALGSFDTASGSLSGALDGVFDPEPAVPPVPGAALALVVSLPEQATSNVPPSKIDQGVKRARVTSAIARAWVRRKGPRGVFMMRKASPTV